MQGNLYCGKRSHLRDREAVRLRGSICLRFALTDWKQAGFPETWLWKLPRGSLRRLGPSNFSQKSVFTLSALWVCRAVALCKHPRKEEVQKSWPSFPHPWTQWEHWAYYTENTGHITPTDPASASSSWFLSPSWRLFPYSASLQTCWRRWFGTISEESSCQSAGLVEIILGKSYFWKQ